MLRRAGIALLLIVPVLVVAPRSDALTGVGISYVIAKAKTVHPGDVGVQQKVRCPQHTVVISGGVRTVGEGIIEIVGSEPFDGGDTDTTPDDGWLGITSNLGTSTKTMRTWAFCAQHPAQYVYATDTSVSVPTGSATSEHIFCPSSVQQVVGGGAFVSGGVASISLRATAPFDFTDVDSDPDDGWFATANNFSGVTQQLTVWAICATTGTYAYPSAMTSLANGSGVVQGTAACPSPQHMTGGGASMDGSNTGAVIQFTIAQDTDGNAKRDALQAGLTNQSNSTVNYVVTTICRTG